MLQPPPGSTLFPYTTLFRSGVGQNCAHFIRAEIGGVRRPGDGKREKNGSGGAKRDRKSTRLNSSHLGISYAVFCLKKKKHLDRARLYNTTVEKEQNPKTYDD